VTIDVDTLTNSMITAGKGLVTGVWQQMETYAIPELKKIAVQIASIAENITQYTPEGAKILLEMQVKATIGVIVAMTSLTMLAVQNAINAILGAVRDFVNGAVGIALL
jgi:Na+/H+-translocating membrane pyrophosphatase